MHISEMCISATRERSSTTPMKYLYGNDIMCNQNICKTSIFIKKATEIHGNTFDYSKVDYKNNHTKVIIICKAGHQFEQRPNSHLNGHGCGLCSKILRKTKDQFINDAIVIRGDSYDYSKVDYKNSRIKVTIICKKAGHIFEQAPNDHLQGKGCPKCADTTKTTDRFVSDAIAIHGDKYDYSKTKYKNNYTKVNIICKKVGHEFEQTLDSSSIPCVPWSRLC